MFGFFEKEIPNVGTEYRGVVEHKKVLKYLNSIPKDKIESVSLRLEHACIFQDFTDTLFFVDENSILVGNTGIIYHGRVDFTMNATKITVEKLEDSGYGGSTHSKVTIKLK